MKPIKMKVKVDITKIPNKMHLSCQQTYKTQVFKPKKGKGSFKREKGSKDNELFL